MSFVRPRPLCGGTNPTWSSTPGATGRNDPGDPSNPIHCPDRTVKGREPNEGRVLLAQLKGAVPAAKREISELFLFDALSNAQEELTVAREVFKLGDSSAAHAVKDWEGLGKIINSYSRIGHLILDFHGFSGGFTIGSDVKQL